MLLSNIHGRPGLKLLSKPGGWSKGWDCVQEAGPPDCDFVDGVVAVCCDFAALSDDRNQGALGCGQAIPGSTLGTSLSSTSSRSAAAAFFAPFWCLRVLGKRREDKGVHARRLGFCELPTQLLVP